MQKDKTAKQRRKGKLVALLVNLCFIAAGVAALAQQPSSTAPSVDRLRQVISYLASDALEGRRTGTPGANDAAHYIAGEFSLLGLRPGMQMAGPARTRGEVRARYLQPFPSPASSWEKEIVLDFGKLPIHSSNTR